ncbi:MAG TPA: hypothetical protein VKV16_02840 [Solirubrobacteraceae bacterium]|nr:hypothetical protein [Solirubrobacteraceae bacterium]
MSVADLRVESRSWRRALEAKAGAEEPRAACASAQTLVCPGCGEVIPLAP